ncbi:Plasma alpha-L-fucosidase [Hypsibius exemplaris]|uniref:Putative alpha-L-fucosidase n=1 Tax=Hypsibius exemplaris TaxID=2072580 RepID=A0A9X6NH89_HYPEX|nr:Plasma alpha-L-fucosidase [Hypsibius exemplaris]
MAAGGGVRYEPTWESIDSRPLPAWYDNAKFGIFIHWGVFSVPSYGSEWFWWYWKGEKRQNYIDFVKNNYGPGYTYADFAPQFHATFYNATKWAKTFETAGAQYVVLTSKHHEGFTMWPSNYSWNWNAMAVGPHRDLVGELSDAIRRSTSLRFGLYHSLFEWFNPLYQQDAANKFSTQAFVKMKTMPELYEIVNRYKPDVIWSDGAPGSSTYWNSTQFIAWLYNDSPVKDTVVTNDRWGDDAMCKHGGFLTCDDRFTPTHLLTRKWEDCLTIDPWSWGYRRDMSMNEVLSVETLISTLASTVSYGGNMLLNVGPTSDGVIPPVFEERLLQIGQWLAVNGEAIYGTQVWIAQNDTITPNIWYTAKQSGRGLDVYAIVLAGLDKDFIVLGVPKVGNDSKVSLLGYEEAVEWDTLSTGELVVTMPRQQDLPYGAQWGVTLKLRFLMNAVKKPNTAKPTAGKPVLKKAKKFRRPALPRKEDLMEPWIKSSFFDL